MRAAVGCPHFFLRAKFTLPIFVAAKENGFAGSSRSGRALSVAER